MEQTRHREYLIRYLLDESRDYRNSSVPSDGDAQKSLLRALVNIRPAGKIDKEFLTIQNEYLQRELLDKGITNINELMPLEGDIYLFKGDITTLRCGAIVNAANSGMTGCYHPCHACIDNCIHTFAGVQLRLECAELMRAQGTAEPTGRAKLTRAYNLPCDYVIHTVGPIVYDEATDEDVRMLASCYEACLRLADENGIGSIAFCCISTGVFYFPQRLAAATAVKTVREYKSRTNSGIKVVFNVFKDRDYEIYRELLGEHREA